jgi:hypothetical protein
MDQLSHNIVKIRKSHNCWGCAVEFPKGSLMTNSVTVDQGEFSNTYWCEECEAYLNTLEYWQIEDGFAYGELIDHKEETFPFGINPK